MRDSAGWARKMLSLQRFLKRTTKPFWLWTCRFRIWTELTSKFKCRHKQFLSKRRTKQCFRRQLSSNPHRKVKKTLWFKERPKSSKTNSQQITWWSIEEMLACMMQAAIVESLMIRVLLVNWRPHSQEYQLANLWRHQVANWTRNFSRSLIILRSALVALLAIAPNKLSVMTSRFQVKTSQTPWAAPTVKVLLDHFV